MPKTKSKKQQRLEKEQMAKKKLMNLYDDGVLTVDELGAIRSLMPWSVISFSDSDVDRAGVAPPYDEAPPPAPDPVPELDVVHEEVHAPVEDVVPVAEDVPEPPPDEDPVEVLDSKWETYEVACEPPVEVKVGCLFVSCIKCASAIMIVFSSKNIGRVVMKIQDRPNNGIVITVCNRCEKSDLDSTMGPNRNLGTYQSRFKEMGVCATFFENSILSKAAASIVGEHVPVIKEHNGIKCLNMSVLMSTLSAEDRIASLSLDYTDSAAEKWALLDYVSGGFF